MGAAIRKNSHPRREMFNVEAQFQEVPVEYDEKVGVGDTGERIFRRAKKERISGSSMGKNLSAEWGTI